jgi:hypothetical protein
MALLVAAEAQREAMSAATIIKGLKLVYCFLCSNIDNFFLML